jgi:hypothetical protein
MNGGFFTYLESIDADDLSILLVSAARNDGNLTLTLTLRSFDDNLHEGWTVEAKGVRRSRVALGDCDGPWELSQDHVLLWPFNQPRASLYFNGKTADWSGLLGELFEVHHALVNDWLSFGECLRQLGRLHELSSAGHGLLAEGPQSLIEAYAERLRARRMAPSILTDPPKRWDGSRWIDETGQLVVMTLGESFVVAEDFDFEKRIAQIRTAQ